MAKSPSSSPSFLTRNTESCINHCRQIEDILDHRRPSMAERAFALPSGLCYQIIISIQSHYYLIICWFPYSPSPSSSTFFPFFLFFSAILLLLILDVNYCVQLLWNFDSLFSLLFFFVFSLFSIPFTSTYISARHFYLYFFISLLLLHFIYLFNSALFY